jgi:hypothetical protein
MRRHPTAPVNVARINVATSGTDFTAPEADFVALIRQSDYPLPRNSLFQTPQIIRSPNHRYVYRVENAIRDLRKDT